MCFVCYYKGPGKYPKVTCETTQPVQHLLIAINPYDTPQLKQQEDMVQAGIANFIFSQTGHWMSHKSSDHGQRHEHLDGNKCSVSYHECSFAPKRTRNKRGMGRQPKVNS